MAFHRLAPVHERERGPGFGDEASPAPGEHDGAGL